MLNVWGRVLLSWGLNVNPMYSGATSGRTQSEPEDLPFLSSMLSAVSVGDALSFVYFSNMAKVASRQEKTRTSLAHNCDL